MGRVSSLVKIEDQMFKLQHTLPLLPLSLGVPQPCEGGQYWGSSGSVAERPNRLWGCQELC